MSGFNNKVNQESALSRRQALPEGAVTTTIHVRYAETDQMRVAHHAHYLVWFELARAAFCRARNIDYNAMEAQGFFLPVVEARCRYLAPARYDDELTLAVWVAGRSSRAVRFGYAILRDTTRIAEGETYQMLTDATGKAIAWPEAIGKLFEATPE